MIKVNSKHSVQYKNGYWLLREHGKTESGNEYAKQDKTYPSLEAMILQCGFEMGYEYTDAAIASKAEYEKKWNGAHLCVKAKKESAEKC